MMDVLLPAANPRNLGSSTPVTRDVRIGQPLCLLAHQQVVFLFSYPVFLCEIGLLWNNYILILCHPFWCGIPFCICQFLLWPLRVTPSHPFWLGSCIWTMFCGCFIFAFNKWRSVSPLGMNFQIFGWWHPYISAYQFFNPFQVFSAIICIYVYMHICL